MTFSPHKGMDLAKICISKMVNWYSNGSSRLNIKQAEILYGVISKRKSESTLNYNFTAAKFHSLQLQL